VDGRAWLLLTERHGDLPQHAGQVALPGGEVEEGETIAQAALREAREEVGLDGGEVRVLGCLTPLHIPVSRFILHPVVGVAERRPALAAQPGEVARVLEVPLDDLSDPRNWSVERRELRGRPYSIPWFDAEGAKLWGATAMVLAEFLVLAGVPVAGPREETAEEAPVTSDRERGPGSAFEPAALLMTTWNDGEASMVRQILENAGIPVQVVSDVPHTVLPIAVDGLGEVRILVPGRQLEEARALLAEHRRQGLEVVDGGRDDGPGDEGGGTGRS